MTTFILDPNGNIINAIVLDADAEWTPPVGCEVVSGDYAVGGRLVDGIYSPPSQSASTPIPTPVVTIVTPRQARLALLAAGLLDQVEATVNAAGGATKIAWDFATQIDRNDPLIISIGASLKLTPDQIDTLFKYAATQ